MTQSKQETEDRRPKTGDRKPGTGDQRPGTVDRRPGTGDRRPGTGDRRPSRSSRIIILIILLPLTVVAQKQDARYYYFEGEEALEQNKYTLALAHYNECIRLDPYYMECYHSRAAAKEALGDIKGALVDYSIYVESKPDQADALLSRAVIRYRLGQYLPAREDFLLLLRLPPGETNKIIFRQGEGGTDKIFTRQNSNHGEVLNYLGLIETKLKNYPKAFTYLDSALKADPGEAQYYVNRGLTKEHVMDTLGALADYQHALLLDPSNGQATHNIAVIKRSRGEQTESEKLLNEAIAKSPALPYPYAARAYYRLQHKDLKGALADYDKVLSIDKTDEESWLYRGLVKERMKDLDGAFIDYTEAITLKNDYARAWLTRGNLLHRMSRYKDAIEDYTVALTWYPEYPQAFYNRAISQQGAGNLKASCEDLGAAERLGMPVAPALKSAVCH